MISGYLSVDKHCTRVRFEHARYKGNFFLDGLPSASRKFHSTVTKDGYDDYLGAKNDGLGLSI